MAAETLVDQRKSTESDDLREVNLRLGGPLGAMTHSHWDSENPEESDPPSAGSGTVTSSSLIPGGFSSFPI